MKKLTLVKLLCLLIILSNIVACTGETQTAPAAGSTSTPAISSVITESITPGISNTVELQTPTPTSVKSTNTPLPPTQTFTVLPTITTITPPIPSGGSYQVHFVDVGQGDSELILTPNKKVVLIDGGEQGTGIVSYLASVGVTQIDVMVLTHPHSDHFGGLVDIFKSGMPVKEVITNGRAANSELFSQFLDGIANAKAEYVEAQRGDKFTVDGMEFDVVSPTKDYTSDDINNTSLVILLKFNGVSFLFTGDQAFDAENNLLASGQNIKADFLKVGHHGSATSTSAAFIQAVVPKVAVYSAGVNNPYHHPAPATIARLSAYVPAIYGTDKDGTIIVTVSPDGYKIDMGKNTGRGPPPAVATPAEPTATPSTPLDAPTATQQASSGNPLTLTIVSVSNPAPKGSNATLTAQTAPGADCTITVYYKSGASKASGLAPKKADSTGSVSWTWKVASNTTAGTWKIVVTASDGTNKITQETTFTVQ